MAVSCPSCGATSPDGATFCMACGQRVTAVSPLSGQPSDPPVVASLPAPPPAPPPTVTSRSAASPVPPAPSPAAPPLPAPPPTVTSPPVGPPTAVSPPVSAPPPPAPLVSAPAPLAPAPLAPPSVPPGQPHPAGGYVPPPPGAGGNSFLARVFTGDWTSSLLAAVWGPLLILAGSILGTIPLDGELGDEPPSWGQQFQLVLAVLLQGLGGGLEITEVEESASSGLTSVSQAFSGTPLLVTLAFAAAVWFGARLVRSSATSTAAALAEAVRTALLTGVLVLVLAFFSQPEIEGAELSTAPVLAALGALLVTLLVSSAVLARPWLSPWLAQRPGALLAARALRTSLVALGLALVVSAVVVWIVLVCTEDWSEAPLWIILLLVLLTPNLAAGGLALAWGAPFEFEGHYGSGETEHESFGLTELGEYAGGWAVTGAVVGGVVCALLVGVLAGRLAKRHGPTQFLVGAFFTAVFLSTVWLSRVGLESTKFEGGFEGFDGSAESREIYLGSGLAALPLTLAWVFGAVLVVPAVMRAMGGRPVEPSYPPHPYSGVVMSPFDEPFRPPPGQPPAGPPPAGPPSAGPQPGDKGPDPAG